MSPLPQPLRSFAGLTGDATYLWPRWLVLRAIGLVYVVVFAGLIHEAPALVGPAGLAPLSGFFAQLHQALPQPVAAFLYAPSLYWLGSGATAIALVSWSGLLAALALVFNLWPRLALGICWVALLSFVTTWQVFSASQVDQLMLEVALLAIPFAPGGLRPGLGALAAPRPLTLFLLRWLLFRIMLENGLIKLLVGDPRWFNLTALDALYETAPFPTFLGFIDHQLPHAWHVVELGLTFIAELVAPLLAVFAGRRGRWFAFAVWTIFQAGIHLTNNFGWLNTASLALGLLLLDDQMLTAAAAKLRLRAVAARCTALAATSAVAPLTGWRRPALACALWTHCAISTFVGVHVLVNASSDTPAPLPAPFRQIAQFHSANAYTLFGALLPARTIVEFEGTADGGTTWHPYRYRFQPTREDQISPFFAPWYARFEATLQSLGNSPDSAPVFRGIAAHLLARTPSVVALFAADPFPDRPARIIRTRTYRYTFTDWKTYRATGRFWTKTYESDYLPLTYLDASGRPVEAQSAFDELRALATHGHRDSQAQLGQAYAYGEGVARDPAAAVTWFQLAAAQGDAASQFFLGLSYAKGTGIAQNHAEAARHYRDAALQGNVPAQTNLGFAYARGEGVARDDIEALAWFSLAARSGRPEATRVRDSFAARASIEVAIAARTRTEALAADVARRAASPPALRP